MVDRFTWAVEQLRVEPDQQVLEIGCGSGVAAGMVADRLRSGRITAVDRSAAAVRRATARNQGYVDDGRATFVTSPVELLPRATYDTVFSFNVSLFWYGPGESVRSVAELLAPTGTLFVFHQPPVEAKVRAVAGRTEGLLRAHGLEPTPAVFRDMRPAPVSCVAARRMR